MKRHTNLYAQICSMSNLELAEKKARKGKGNRREVKEFNKNREANLRQIQYELLSKTYRTSPYEIFKIFDKKEREIYKLPYRDRIVHHAIMNILEQIFVRSFTADTYSCIKGRGIHKCSFAIRKALRDERNTQYCLKFDIRKFYPSIDHAILKQLLRRKIKDNDLLWLLDGIIDSAPGVPIGNYLSQYFANFYLTYFDHYIKEVLKVKYYFRYADDVAILAATKDELHRIFHILKEYLHTEFKLEIKPNRQIFPVTDAIPIDMVGYQHFRHYIKLRPSIKRDFARAVSKGRTKSMPSYNGWAQHCNSGNLIRKLAA